ncbi:MAG: THUMP domain-containing protein, partial [Clostridia bacterium]
MKELILVKQGEMVLKGLNKKTFETLLIKNIKKAIINFGEFKIYTAQSTVYVEPLSENIYIDDVVDRLSKVFGIVSICRACICEKSMESIKNFCDEYLPDFLFNFKSFKVEAKRADKKFPLNSPEICNELGGYILEK